MKKSEILQQLMNAYEKLQIAPDEWIKKETERAREKGLNYITYDTHDYYVWMVGRMEGTINYILKSEGKIK